MGHHHKVLGATRRAVLIPELEAGHPASRCRLIWFLVRARFLPAGGRLLLVASRGRERGGRRGRGTRVSLPLLRTPALSD